jgi:hypothetical protein
MNQRVCKDGWTAGEEYPIGKEHEKMGSALHFAFPLLGEFVDGCPPASPGVIRVA